MTAGDWLARRSERQLIVALMIGLVASLAIAVARPQAWAAGLLATLVAAVALWGLVQRDPAAFPVALRRFIVVLVALPLVAFGIRALIATAGSGTTWH